MAKTYYKYQKRDDAIDWSKIGSDISKTLTDEANRRETEKASIDEASREFQKTLNQGVESDNNTIQDFALNAASEAEKARLMQDRLLKNGLITTNQYTKQRQKVSQGIDDSYEILNNIAKINQAKMERMQSGASAGQEQWMAANNEAIMNLQTHGVYINPETGEYNMAKKDGEGGISSDPNTFSSMNILRKTVSNTVDKYNVMGRTDDIAKSLNIDYKVVRYKDGVAVLNDSTLRKGFDAAKKNIIDSELVVPTQVGSVLTDYVGTAPNGELYGFTQDSKEQNENTILLKLNSAGTGYEPDFDNKFGKQQKEQARKALEGALDVKMKRNLTAYDPRKDDKLTDTEERNNQFISDLVNMSTGNASQFESLAKDYQSRLNQQLQKNDAGKVTKLSRDEDKFIINLTNKGKDSEIVIDRKNTDNTYKSIEQVTRDLNRELGLVDATQWNRISGKFIDQNPDAFGGSVTEGSTGTEKGEATTAFETARRFDLNRGKGYLKDIFNKEIGLKESGEVKEFKDIPPAVVNLFNTGLKDITIAGEPVEVKVVGDPNEDWIGEEGDFTISISGQEFPFEFDTDETDGEMGAGRLAQAIELEINRLINTANKYGGNVPKELIKKPKVETETTPKQRGSGGRRGRSNKNEVETEEGAGVGSKYNK
tara:strand:+ start:13498 stop:15459 length:1962 start_codon:yes stop_codon:yes gene_type:complete